MDEGGRKLFTAGTIASVFSVSFQYVLEEYIRSLGPAGAARLDEIERYLLGRIKNATPTGLTTDDMMQAAVEESIASFQDALAQVRRNLASSDESH